jgi:hypothetical protein
MPLHGLYHSTVYSYIIPSFVQCTYYLHGRICSLDSEIVAEVLRQHKGWEYLAAFVWLVRELWVVLSAVPKDRMSSINFMQLSCLITKPLENETS